jgi:hypothetical protein
MLVVHAIPKENAAVHGFIDGARAAMDFADEMRSKSLASEHADPAALDHGPDRIPATSGA